MRLFLVKREGKRPTPEEEAAATQVEDPSDELACAGIVSGSWLLARTPLPTAAAGAGAVADAVASAVALALRREAMRLSVEVRQWERPGCWSVKLHDDHFDTFCAVVAAAACAGLTDLTRMQLYYFRGAVLLAERIAITDDASLRAFVGSRCAVWVYFPAAAGLPSPDALLSALPDAPIAPSVPSGRSSQQQRYFRAALLKRDGTAVCALRL